MSTPACVLFLSMLGLSGAPSHSVLLPGSFHGNEVSAMDGESWLALIDDSEKPALRQVTVRVHSVHDLILDADGESTGREVDVPELDTPPLALLRGPLLHAGELRHRSGNRHAFEFENEVLALDAERQEHLALQCDAWQPIADAEPDEVSRCRLGLSRAGVEQVLHEVETRRYANGALMLGSDGHWALLFAGDLDGDGHTDLLMQLNDHYNVSQTVLFLSSAADTGELVREVARFQTIGC